MSSFKGKGLRIKFTLSNNSVFPGGPPGQASNVLTLTGLRVVAQISAQGAPAFPTCECAIYGMYQSDMNAVTSLTQQVTGIQRNTMQIDANPDTSNANGWSTVWVGQIVTAGIDYSGAPDVCLRVTGQISFFDAINPATPTSYPDSTAVATIASTIAGKLGFAFENNGVTTVLPGPQYFPGTLTEQLRDLESRAGIDRYMEGGAVVQTLAICPKGSPRKNLPPFTLTPQNGLQGYSPVDSRGYIRVTSIYNPAFRFGGPLTIAGSDVIVDTQTATPSGLIKGTLLNARANGLWMIGQMGHRLESAKFEGAWFTDMLLYPPNSEPPQQ